MLSQLVSFCLCILRAEVRCWARTSVVTFIGWFNLLYASILMNLGNFSQDKFVFVITFTDLASLLLRFNEHGLTLR